MRIMQERIGIIFNVDSLYHVVNKEFNSLITYPSLLKSIRGDDRRVIFNVACVLGNFESQEPFLAAIRKMGMTVINSNTKEELRDSFAFQMIRIGPLVDTLVLATHDHCVLPIVDYLEDTGRKPMVEIWTVKNKFPSAMIDCFDSYCEITEQHIYRRQ